MSSLLISEKDSAVHIMLNRPEALNALTHEMVLSIVKALQEYKERSDIDIIIFQGAGEKAFCAGGDVKAAYHLGKEWRDQGRKDANPACHFFRDEYRMNAMIHHYPKRIISLCHGYVMGGGYGIAGNGQDIVVCETTKFAMPETILGFFSDVGIGWKLGRLGALGMYLALTGRILNYEEMLAYGLADYFLPCKDFDNFSPVKLKTNTNKIEISHREDIEAIFSQETVGDIMEALATRESDFAKETLLVLQARSPMSLAITHRHLKMAAQDDYDKVIARDYQLACAFFAKADVYEGIRAQLIDKDKAPKWQYSSIFNISQADIDYYLNFIEHV